MAERITDLLADISRHSAPGAGVSRLPFTPEHRAALDTIRGWMEKAGLTVTIDAAGTMIGRREGIDAYGRKLTNKPFASLRICAKR